MSSNAVSTDMFSIRNDATGEVLMRGSLATVMSNIPDTHARIDALEELEAARIKSEHIDIMQGVTRGIQTAALCDSISSLARRFDAFMTRRAERLRADAEEAEREQQQAIEDALSKLPDPDAPHELAVDGELTTHEPTEPHKEEELEAIAEGEEHRDLSAKTELSDSEGDLPPELLEEAPPVTGTDPVFPGAREPTARNPVAISLSADSLYPPGTLSPFTLDLK